MIDINLGRGSTYNFIELDLDVAKILCEGHGLHNQHIIPCFCLHHGGVGAWLVRGMFKE